jgi:3-hydroxybutyryl-CoA dehydrogenase
MNPNEITRVAVIGAGVMGHSIAFVFARAGLKVALFDTSQEALTRARDLMDMSMEVLAEAGRFSPEDRDALLGRIDFSLDLEESCRDAEFVIEAVPEVMEIKREVFERVEEYCRRETIIASNTSGLDIFSINPRTADRFVIAHWYAPPYIIPLVEVVGGPSTRPTVIDFTAALMERLGKKPVIMKEFTRGFIANKVQNGITMAVMELLLGGLATPGQIDEAVKYSLGIRLPIVGVVQNMDCTGLDTVLDIMKSYGICPPMFEEKVARGELGIKTSRGMYDYGGRSEREVLAKRDRLYLQQLDCLEQIGTFAPL